MNRLFKIVLFVTMIVFTGMSCIGIDGSKFGDLRPAVAYAAGNDDKVADTDTVSVIFSHDMHSHMGADKAVKDGETVETGGIARLKTAMDEVKEKYPDSFVLDAGDFSMGTPYQVIFSQEASELKMMDYIGIEATTLGNHEFDYRTLGLASMLENAKGSDVAFLASNIDWDAALADPELSADAEVLRDAFDAYGVREYTVIEHDDAKVALFGLMGESAVDYAPEAGLIFKDATEAAAETVAKIKAETDADIIVCLSHCGTVENEEDVMEETEDYLLAEAVPEIDLIISGHTHTVLDEVVQAGDTYIVSCGSYNANMGHVVLEPRKDDSGRYDLVSYDLIALDETVEPDAETEKELAKYTALLDDLYFSEYGYSAEQVIAENDIGFTPITEFGIEQGEDPLGDLIADSYKYALKQAGDSADITIVPNGVIRGSFFEGDITVTDAFNVSSLGYGKDGKSGYPLVKAYLTGRELKAIAEVDASISNFMGVARLYCSGLEYSWNPNRLILNRAVDVKVGDGGNAVAVEDEKLYSVVADLYSCQMLGSVKDKSFGLLKIEPKDENGQLITDFEDHIIYDDGREIKAWYALASYIDSFEDDQVPEYYAQTHGRKTEIDSWNPVEIFKQPNNIAWIAAGALAVLVLIVIAVIALIRKLRRRKKL